MTILRFLPEDDFKSRGISAGKLCEKDVFDIVKEYIPPASKDDEKQMGLRHTPTFHRNVLYRFGEHSRQYCGKEIPDKNLEVCLVAWGMSKFQTVPDYKDTIKAREQGAAACESEEALEVYVCAVKDVFGDKILNTKTKEAKIHTSLKQYNYISNIADNIGMTAGQVALYFFYLGVKYTNLNLPDEYKMKKYECETVDKMISLVDEHIRTLWFDIERYNKILSVRGNSLL